MHKKILLADDSITIQKVVELTFSEGDYQVISVGNGAQALQMIEDLRPDVALLDVIMPQVNGYEVCEKVKNNPATAGIPVLLLTGTFEPFDRKRAEASGADGHLTKPFESQMLITRVEELISVSREEASQEETSAEMAGPEEEHPSCGSEEAAGTAAELSSTEPSGESAESVEQASPIVPDRYDDRESRLGTVPGSEEGIQTIRISSDEAPTPEPSGFTPEEISGGEEPSEAWDELANGLATASPSTLPGVGEDEFQASGFVAPSEKPVQADPEPEGSESRSFLPAEGGQPLDASSSVSPATDVPSGLNQADVDRIATRVVEQLSEKVIREISWEVIPELAETLIKQRIRELEEKISREG